MQALRARLFNALFFSVWFIMSAIGIVVFPLPRWIAMELLKLWARIEIWLLRVVCDTHLEIRGIEKLPEGGFVLAAKHQSPFETFALMPLMSDPAFVLKKELMSVPLFGWWCRKFRMIPVDRDAGTKGMKDMAALVQTEADRGRQIVIFPEGTRTDPGAKPDYKPGVAFLYAQLNVPCVPMALNSGLFWPGKGADRYPGTIVFEFGDPIPPGLDRRTFMKTLVEAIEAPSDRLIEETAAKPNPPPTLADAQAKLAMR